MEIQYKKGNINYQQQISDLDDQIAKLRQIREELQKVTK